MLFKRTVWGGRALTTRSTELPRPFQIRVVTGLQHFAVC